MSNTDQGKTADTPKTETSAAPRGERVPRGRVVRNPKGAKPARIPMNQLSPKEREARREQARVTPTGSQPAQKGIAAAEAAGAPRHRRLRQRMKRQASKVLYFIDGNSPSEDEYNEALGIGPGVVFRNARKIVLGAPLENADAVAGPAIPPDYAAFYDEAGKGFEVEEGEMPEGMISRPNRTHRQVTGYAPDDVRPGTVDDGIAHASGTGSSQPGNRTADPTTQNLERGEQSEARALAGGWKAGKTPGALG